jgi:hypothetical protein
MKAIVSISRALRLLRVLDANEAPEAEDAETALEALNKMMRRWEADGIALGWNTLTNIDQELNVPEEAEDAIEHNLAVKLRPEYGVAIDPDVRQEAQTLLAALRRDVIVANPVTHDDPGWGYDIRSDSYYGGRP